MSGLVLKLKANEEVLVNGVRLCNGARSTRLIVKSPDAKILRLSEAIHEDEAQSPLAQLCLLAQRVVAGQHAEDTALPALADGITALERSGMNDAERALQLRSLDALRDRNVYAAFRALKKMLRDAQSSGRSQPPSGTSSGSTGSSDATR
ncbi:MAG: flagellar biosynthesis repressor FlbT [Pseudomonadota bacterium]